MHKSRHLDFIAYITLFREAEKSSFALPYGDVKKKGAAGNLTFFCLPKSAGGLCQLA